MHKVTLAFTMLALFTSADKAAEIEGDLLEQAQRHGRLWFWFNVKRTCMALFFHGLKMDAGRLLLSAYGVYELVLKLEWWALRPVKLRLRDGIRIDRGQHVWTIGFDLDRFMLVNDLINALVAFALAMLVVRLSPKHGGQITVLAAGFMFGRLLLLDGMWPVPRFIGFVLLPAILGMLAMKWQELRHGVSQDPHASH